MKSSMKFMTIGLVQRKNLKSSIRASLPMMALTCDLLRENDSFGNVSSEKISKMKISEVFAVTKCQGIMPIPIIEKGSSNATAMGCQSLLAVVLGWSGMLIQTLVAGLLFLMYLVNKLFNI